MRLDRITTVDQVDEIIPMIQKLHKETDKYISLAGFLTWITINLINPQSKMQIWKVTHENKTVGYAIAEITLRYFVPECTVVDAYIEINDPKFVDEVEKFIMDWAEANACKIFSCYTNRAQAMSKRHGFDSYGTLLMKRIGG